MSLDQPISFESSDAIGWHAFSENLEKYLLIDSAMLDGSLVVSIEGSFGSGKTHFLKMWETSLLGKLESSINDGFFPVYLNVWKHDYSENAVVTVLWALVNSIRRSQDQDGRSANIKLTETLRRWTAVAMSLAEQYVRNEYGLSGREALEVADSQGGSREVKFFSAITAFRDTVEEIKTQLANLATERKILLLVDELDRCRPDFAVKYLEAFTHIFNINGMVVALGIDRGQLASSSKALFGSDLDTEEYLRKFIRRSFQLPSPNLKEYESLLRHMWLKLIEIVDARGSLATWDGEKKSIVQLVATFRMTPRQIESVFLILGHLFQRENVATRIPNHRLKLCILLVCLKICQPSIYRSLASGYFAIGDLISYLHLLKLSSLRDWITLCVLEMPESQCKGRLISVAGEKLPLSGYVNPRLIEKVELEQGDDDSGWIYFAYHTIESAGKMEKS